ncbi:putative lipoprotein [Ehrlichia chaffeensis str. Heartland]|uniref:Lipoprotein n=1 Tax=Ehrlichia chaffeensis (strain ATCC CRL-10679 / Arkansas) TaxID=205920 RepID=Q2GHX7_EHRCR|nr:hypothetical protein [Ehrlichia chaffeensis]ABD44634.1 putative lipoprotein [Ehrlichia chaffeensis str. Arkansas]AHX04076.1 putative lipoprotein [Ehrlichia chaffeensis str. Heartland]AHX06009.1 putative lipoprotein [Ehrlichia chaffeensis str. Jax]AHX06999.1 putative lipoprotein [Ehrlichia chaffeensis str. Liberty]AHX07580.1 putative lipoprotein [Ehrlichia chaffeensis str. Osceola]
MLAKEVWGWFFMMLITTSCSICAVFSYLDVKKDLVVFSQQYRKVIENDVRSVLVQVNQNLLNSYLSKQKENCPVQRIITSENNDIISCSNEEWLAKLLLSVINLREAFLGDISVKSIIYSIKPMLLKLDDYKINEAVAEIERLDSKKLTTFNRLKFSFKKIARELHYSRSNMVQKVFFKWVVVKNQQDALLHNLKEVEIYLDDNLWSDALDLSRKELSSVAELELWIQQLEDVVSMEKNISLIYDQLSKYIIKLPGVS